MSHSAKQSCSKISLLALLIEEHRRNLAQSWSLNTKETEDEIPCTKLSTAFILSTFSQSVTGSTLTWMSQPSSKSFMPGSSNWATLNVSIGSITQSFVSFDHVTEVQ